jgi:hypothetical protein
MHQVAKVFERICRFYSDEDVRAFYLVSMSPLQLSNIGRDLGTAHGPPILAEFIILMYPASKENALLSLFSIRWPAAVY